MNFEIYVPKVHDFQEDLAWSELPEQYIAYMRAIVHWWPDAIGWKRITDIIQQKQGKDVVLELPEDKKVKLQFKARTRDYGDLLIEYRHDLHNGNFVKGWIEKKSDVDFLLYCVPRKVYRVNYQRLYSVWESHKEEWISKYDVTPAKNLTYNTRNVCVPFYILGDAKIEIDRLVFREPVATIAKKVQNERFKFT